MIENTINILGGMIPMNQKFYPLLFGGDINVYSVARAFHEAYGIKSTCYGKFSSGPADRSAIIDYRVCAENEDPAVYLENTFFPSK